MTPTLPQSCLLLAVLNGPLPILSFCCDSVRSPFNVELVSALLLLLMVSILLTGEVSFGI